MFEGSVGTAECANPFGKSNGTSGRTRNGRLGFQLASVDVVVTTRPPVAKSSPAVRIPGSLSCTCFGLTDKRDARIIGFHDFADTRRCMILQIKPPFLEEGDVPRLGSCVNVHDFAVTLTNHTHVFSAILAFLWTAFRLITDTLFDSTDVGS